MTTLARRLAIVAALLIARQMLTEAAVWSPLHFLAPSAPIDAADRSRLDAGLPIVRVLPGRGQEIGIVAAVRVAVSADRLIAWTRAIDRLHAGRYVPAIARFSEPPCVEDVGALSLPEADVQDLRRCRPGACGLKLSAAEIADVRRGITTGARWENAALDGVRRLLVQRAAIYRALGDEGTAPYHDDRDPLDPRPLFAALVAHTEFLDRDFPQVADYLRAYPQPPPPDVVDSFLYWSVEALGGKPITSVTHTTIARSLDPRRPEVLVVSKQVFATHYKNTALMVMALTASPSGRYLVIVHRSNLDVLRGLFGGLVRKRIERRLRADAPGVLDLIRKRLESGEPPSLVPRALSFGEPGPPSLVPRALSFGEASPPSLVPRALSFGGAGPPSRLPRAPSLGETDPAR